MAARRARSTGTFYAPNPEDAVDVLAFVLCPARAFAPAGDEEELDAVRELLAPMKLEAVKRWASKLASRTRS